MDNETHRWIAFYYWSGGIIRCRSFWSGVGNCPPQLRPPRRLHQEHRHVWCQLLYRGSCQRQMLSIEMVLAQEPELALLDEPPGALSPDLTRSILETVAQYVSTSSSAVLLVEQNQLEANAVSSKCLQLSEGVIQEVTTKYGGNSI